MCYAKTLTSFAHKHENQGRNFFFFNYLYIYHAKCTFHIKQLDPKMHLFETSKLVNLLQNIFPEQNLNLLLKQSFTHKESSSSEDIFPISSKHPFAVQSQILATYEMRQRTAPATKLHKGISHPGSLQFTKCLLAQTRCNAHHGLPAFVSPWKGTCVREKHWALALFPWILDHQPPPLPLHRCSLI